MLTWSRKLKGTHKKYIRNKDATGHRYVFQAIGELDKNHCADARSIDTISEGRMYKVKGSSRCPVASFEKYLSKLLPKCDCLWQRPLNTFKPDDIVTHIEPCDSSYI